MLVYNITVKVENNIAEKWLRWQLDEHIPEILSSGLFTDHKIFRLLADDDDECVTYVTQFYTTTIKNYNNYISEFAPRLRKEAIQKWGEKFIAHRTLMETVQ